MSEFQELIKNFERIRNYMRQFYVYGFKVRSEYDSKSARTYDNERRRIESWLGEYIRSEYSDKGKQVSINVDSRQIYQNPLYAAWKSKSYQVLLDVLAAMQNQQIIRFSNTSSRSGNVVQMMGIPLKIFVSTRTGRRYVCMYQGKRRRRFINIRLDAMSQIQTVGQTKDYEILKKLLEQNLPSCWGVSFGGSSRMEEIYLKLYIDEEQEPYVLDRLYREGRCGEVRRVAKNTFLYSGKYFDTNEMLGWIRTFIGRILDIQGTNDKEIRRFLHDFEKLYDLYKEI